MTDWNVRWQELLTELEQEREELRLKLHLATADARDGMARLDEQFDRRIDELKANARVELDKLDAKLDTLRTKARSFDKEGDGIMDDIGDAAKDLAGEIRMGFQRIRDMF